jgi:hypothetical protein
VVSAYLPNVLVGSPCPVSGTRTPPIHIYCGSWAGFPQKTGCHRTRGRAGLAAASSGARGGTGPLSRWEGSSGPHHLAQARRPPGGPASTRRGPDHPAVDRAGGISSCASCPRGLVEAPDLPEHGGWSGDRDPNCQARAVRPVTQRLSARLRITSRPSGWTQ